MNTGKFDPHIRAINIRKDLPAIADLIDLCFSEQMDAEGRDYLRHIRQIASGVGAFIIDGNTPESSPFPFHGYLWEEDGRVIGNLTLILIRRVIETYFIANVAVHPSQRGKGIARQLTDRAIAHVREHNGKQICLQVREDNPTAFRIYQETGFKETARRTSWVFPQGYQPGAPLNNTALITRRKAEDWHQQVAWLNQIYPPEVAWNIPYNTRRLKPSFSTWFDNMLNNISVRSWAVKQQNELLGAASFESGVAGSDYVWLAASAENDDMVIRKLMPHIYAKVFKPHRIVVNYPAGRGMNSFSGCGMKELHTLIWMKKEISPENLL